MYNDYEKQGRIIRNIPFEAQHGQRKMWFHHDHFSRDESKDLLRLAFEIDYIRNGASMLRNIKTTFEGYLYCNNHPDRLVRKRSKTYKDRLKMMRYFLTASTVFVQNRQSEILLKDIKKLFLLHFGRMNIFTFATSMVVVFFSVKEYLRCRIVGDVRVPGTSCRTFNNNKIHEHQGKQAKVSSATGTKPGIAYSWSEQPQLDDLRSPWPHTSTRID